MIQYVGIFCNTKLQCDESPQLKIRYQQYYIVWLIVAGSKLKTRLLSIIFIFILSSCNQLLYLFNYSLIHSTFLHSILFYFDIYLILASINLFIHSIFAMLIHQFVFIFFFCFLLHAFVPSYICTFVHLFIRHFLC